MSEPIDEKIEEPTIEWLIDKLCPETSPLANLDKKRLLALIQRKEDEARIEEVTKARDAWHGTDDDEFAALMNARLAELHRRSEGGEG